MRIGVIAPGNMGAAVARRLHAARRRGRESRWKGAAPRSAKRAEGLTVKPDEASLGGWAEVMLSILPPGEALASGSGGWRRCCGGGKRSSLTAMPSRRRRCARSRRRCRMCVSSTSGLSAGHRAGITRGRGSMRPGDAAAALTTLREWGIDLRPIEGGIGAASALKMSYAGITKGMIALGSAMALGATAAGAAEALRAELAASQPDVLRSLERGVPGMFDKAYRWVAEMEEISDFLGSIPAAPIYQGAARLYEAIAADQAKPAADGPVARLAAFYQRK